MLRFFRRIHYVLNRRRLQDELADEMAFHREMAAREGNASFGNELRLREESRDAWGWTWADRFFQDVRFALRLLQRSPLFTLAAVLMLAVGIGANVAAFSFFNLIILKPLPLREPESLLRFHRLAPGNFSSDVSFPAMVFYREHSQTLASVLALDVGRLVLESKEEELRAHFVTANFFTDLGASAALGRLIDPATGEDPAVSPVVVLGYDFWQRQYGSDPSVLGRQIRLNGKPATVIGVVARNFTGFTYNSPEVWLSLAHQPHFVSGSVLFTSYSPDTDGVDMWGRVRPGVDRRAVEQELQVLTAELRKQRPKDFWDGERLVAEQGGFWQNAGGRHRGTSPAPSLRQKVYPILALIGSLTLLILAAVCANLGSLLLVRGVTRQREMSIRRAVGAGAGRIFRQLITESLVLGCAGSALGLGFGYVLLKVMLVWTGAPAGLDPSPDWHVAVFTLFAGLASVLFFGLTPAIQIVRQRHQTSVARQVLVAAQVCASCVLLIVAGLLVRGLNHATHKGPGFDYKQAIMVDPQLASHGYNSGVARAYLDTLQNRLRSLPGVEQVVLSTTPPLGNRTTSMGVERNGRDYNVYLNSVSPEFLRAMRIAVLRGRSLNAGERDAVVVSDSLARKFWPGEDPLEKQFELGASGKRVVGIASNAQIPSISDADAFVIYQNIDESELPSASVLVRCSAPVESVVPLVSSAARGVDLKITPSVRTLKTAHANRLDSTERSALSASVLGVASLLLASLGIVGVVAYAVSQRSKEISIRMALGASASHVLSVVLRQLLPPVASGLALGIVGAVALSQFLRQELHGLSNHDPLSYLASMAVFLFSAALASLLPARRALSIDPMKSLRQD